MGMQKIKMRMQGMKCECWESVRNAENLGGNGKNAGNPGGDAGSQNEKLGVAVEMTQNSNGNNKFKVWK